MSWKEKDGLVIKWVTFNWRKRPGAPGVCGALVHLTTENPFDEARTHEMHLMRLRLIQENCKS